jgi:hypothetical protein
LLSSATSKNTEARRIASGKTPGAFFSLPLQLGNALVLEAPASSERNVAKQ